MRETDIQKAILQYLAVKRVFAFRINTTGVWDPTLKIFRKGSNTLRGVSDILGIYKGKMLAIEVKQPKGKTSVEQDYFLSRVNENGGLGFVARSVDDVIARGI